MFNCCHSDGETTKKNYKEKQSIFFTFKKKIFFYVYKCCFEMIKGWKKKRKGSEHSNNRSPPLYFAPS